ncbi:hypothetical protein [Thermus oshimai]|uniref:hypothetical protein n=1 Tax=Thermus oshimai TaxID=56957 RepID=UPI002378A5BB|nr:hypothetical protein [Thermus oshimai]
MAIIGAGYVGLTTGVALAYLGHWVTLVKLDEGKVEDLRWENLPFHEAYLENHQKLLLNGQPYWGIRCLRSGLPVPCEPAPEDYAVMLPIWRQSLAGSRDPIVFKPLLEEDPKQLWSGVTLAERFLGRELKVPVWERLERTLDRLWGHGC